MVRFSRVRLAACPCVTPGYRVSSAGGKHNGGTRCNLKTLKGIRAFPLKAMECVASGRARLPIRQKIVPRSKPRLLAGRGGQGDVYHHRQGDVRHSTRCGPGLLAANPGHRPSCHRPTGLAIADARIEINWSAVRRHDGRTPRGREAVRRYAPACSGHARRRSSTLSAWWRQWPGSHRARPSRSATTVLRIEHRGADGHLRGGRRGVPQSRHQLGKWCAPASAYRLAEFYPACMLWQSAAGVPLRVRVPGAAPLLVPGCKVQLDLWVYVP